MDSRTTLQVKPKPALGFAAAILSVLLSQASFAQTDYSAFRMMAITNASQGKLVVKGRYETAIRRLEARVSARDTFELHNNLCVAYTKTSEMENAMQSCDAAVDAAGVNAKRTRHNDSFFRQRHLRDAAIALSNRGVLRAVTGDKQGARADFERSLALFDELKEPRINLAYLGEYAAENATAQYAR